MRVSFNGSFVMVIGVALGLAALVSPASATLSVFQTFSDAALSIDGGTFNSTFINSNGDTTSDSGSVPLGIVNPLQSDTPAGATILAAYLYVVDVFGGCRGRCLPTVAGDVTLNGQFLPVADGTLLTSAAGDDANTRRFDVTTNVTAVIATAGGGLVTHTYSESGLTDGAVLVVAWKNASTAGGTAIILDGALAVGGDTTTVSFAPYAGGDFLMSLADSFSFGPSQFTTIDVTTSSTPKRRLSNCAGGNDESNANGLLVDANGLLMTAGGIGDSPTNPGPTCSGAAADDELYNLALGDGANASPFIKLGDTSLTFDTNNPSHDDNVFGMFLQFGVVAGPPAVPEPASLVLLGAGLAGLGIYFRRGRRR